MMRGECWFGWNYFYTSKSPSAEHSYLMRRNMSFSMPCRSPVVRSCDKSTLLFNLCIHYLIDKKQEIFEKTIADNLVSFPH